MFQTQINHLQNNNGAHKYTEYSKLQHIFGLLFYCSLWNKGKKHHEKIE
jgi:hypothetical protein